MKNYKVIVIITVVIIIVFFSNSCIKNPAISKTTDKEKTTIERTVTHYTEPQISGNIPQTIYPMLYTSSDSNVASTELKLYFISGSDVYYTNNSDGSWQIKKMGITNAEQIEAYGSFLYILLHDDKLLIYDVNSEIVIHEVNLDNTIEGKRIGLYQLSCADERGVFFFGYVSPAMNTVYNVFLNVSSDGVVSLIKEFDKKDVARLALVKGNTFYYDWQDRNDNDDYAVCSWNKDTDQTTIISRQMGTGIVDDGVTYNVWDNKLVFPAYDKGICIADLDGTSEKIYKCEFDSNCAVIGDYVYFPGQSLRKINLKTGKMTSTKEGDYRGTVSVFNNQLILLRYEGDSGTLQFSPRSIYVLNQVKFY